MISIRFVVPLSADTAAKNALLLPVLLRGSEHYPDIGKIRREEESIYDTGISDSVYKRGDLQILELRMNLLENQYAIDGMDITGRAMALLEDILFHPVTENGVFRGEYVESEKRMLIDDTAHRSTTSAAMRRCVLSRRCSRAMPSGFGARYRGGGIGSLSGLSYGAVSGGPCPRACRNLCRRQFRF